jgi:hypothetical protein
MIKLQFKKDGCGITWLDTKAYSDFIGSLQEGQVVDVNVKVRMAKTNQQLAYYYDAILPACTQGLIDIGYDTLASLEFHWDVPRKITTDDCDMFLKELFMKATNKKEFPLKRKMTITEMMEYIDWVLTFMATELQVVVDLPK